MRTKRVFFIEDNEITSIALRAIIDQAVHLEYVGQATEVKGVLDRIRASTPHVVLMKWPLENGLELIKQLQELIPSPAVALFAPNDDTPGIAEAVICGAHGVLIKGMQAKALETALWSVGAGGIWIERATFNRMFTQPNVPQPSKVVALELKEAERLSPREKEIAALIADSQNAHQQADAEDGHDEAHADCNRGASQQRWIGLSQLQARTRLCADDCGRL
jgi:DNA-binding NarL/FixJ family response regulator